jgi:hypothetical protein
MIANDNDVIRAVGYVTIFSSYLEDAVDGMLNQLIRISGTTRNKNIWAVTLKLKEIKRLLPETTTNHEEHISYIDSCIAKIEQRNRITHGKLIGGMGGRPDRLISGRDGSEKDITPEEVYRLANELDDLHRQVRAVAYRLNGAEFV